MRSTVQKDAACPCKTRQNPSLSKTTERTLLVNLCNLFHLPVDEPRSRTSEVADCIRKIHGWRPFRSGRAIALPTVELPAHSCVLPGSRSSPVSNSGQIYRVCSKGIFALAKY